MEQSLIQQLGRGSKGIYSADVRIVYNCVFNTKGVDRVCMFAEMKMEGCQDRSSFSRVYVILHASVLIV